MLSKADKKFLFDTFATKKDLRDILEFSTATFATKDDVLGKFDAIMTELKAMREEVTVLAYRQADHSDRIDRLEHKTGLA
jgi:hypothetical protein